MIGHTGLVLKLRQRCLKCGHILRCEVPGCRLHVIVRRQDGRVPFDHASASVVGGLRLRLMMRLCIDSCKAGIVCRAVAPRVPIILCTPPSCSTPSTLLTNTHKSTTNLKIEAIAITNKFQHFPNTCDKPLLNPPRGELPCATSSVCKISGYGSALVDARGASR